MNKPKESINEGQDLRMEKVIVNYLEMETSYALLINGRRGIGKTFFIKDRIIPKIGEVKVYHDQSKTYKPVYISLYGLKSMDEVFTLMAIEFMPWLNNKGVKIGLSIGKLVTRGLLNINKAGDVDTYLKDLSTTAKHSIDTKDFVIIFDDLDRISGSLQIGEIVGFINSLVEHENNKILVIADEEHLNNSEAYLAVREKTVGTVIEYASTFSYNFDAIITSKYKATYRSYYDYLLSLKKDILYWFEQTDTQNLRTLIYFLQHFHEIFSRIHLALDLKQLDRESLGFKKVKAILQFSIAISIEFKKGVINYKKTKGLDDMRAIGQILQAKQLEEMYGFHRQTLQNPTAHPVVESYRDNFLATYYNGSTYEYYPSLYNFITGGDAIDIDSLLQQLKLNFDDRIYRPSPQDSVYHQLSTPGVLDLSNEEYTKLSDKMLKYALEAKYPLDRYLSVLFYLTRYPEIKPYDVSKTAERLIKSIKLHRNKFKYVDTLSSTFGFEETTPGYQSYLNLFRALNEVNNGINAARVKNIRADTLKEFIQSPEEFYEKIKNYYDYNQTLLAYWNFDKFYQHFQTMPGSEIPRFTQFLKVRFGEVLIQDKLEYYFLEQLFNQVRKVDHKAPVTLRSGEIDKLGELIGEILTKNMRFKLEKEKS